MTIAEIFELIDEDYALIRKSYTTRKPYAYNYKKDSIIFVTRPVDGAIYGARSAPLLDYPIAECLRFFCDNYIITDTDSWELYAH